MPKIRQRGLKHRVTGQELLWTAALAGHPDYTEVSIVCTAADAEFNPRRMAPGAEVLDGEHAGTRLTMTRELVLPDGSTEALPGASATPEPVLHDEDLTPAEIAAKFEACKTKAEYKALAKLAFDVELGDEMRLAEMTAFLANLVKQQGAASPLG